MPYIEILDPSIVVVPGKLDETVHVCRALPHGVARVALEVVQLVNVQTRPAQSGVAIIIIHQQGFMRANGTVFWEIIRYRTLRSRDDEKSYGTGAYRTGGVDRTV